MKTNYFYIVMLLIISTTFALGIWQTKRYFYKQNINIMLKNDLSTKTNHIDDQVNIDKFKIYNISGSIDKNKLILIKPRKYNNIFGAHIYVSLHNKTSGNNYIINMGFVDNNNLSKIESILPDKIKIKAISFKENNNKFFMPKNDTKNKVWLYVNLTDFTQYFNITNNEFYFINLSDEFRYIKPILGNDFKVNNPHMKYIFFWFLLSITFMFMSYRHKKK